MAWKPTVWVVALGVFSAGARGQQASPVQETPTASQPAALEGMSVPELLEAADQAIVGRQFARAEEALQRVLQRDSTNVEAIFLLAETAEALGNIIGARTLYLRILEIEKNHFGANFGLARAWSRSRVWRQAAQYLRVAERVAPPDRIGDVQAFLASALRGMHQWPEALAVAQKAINAAPDSIIARQTIAGIYMDMGNFEGALGAAEVLVAISAKQLAESPGSFGALQNMDAAFTLRISALTVFVQSFYEINESGQRVDRLVPGAERDTAAVLNELRKSLEAQAELQLRMRYHEALPAALRAASYAPENLDYLRDLALLHQKTYQIDEAIATYRRILEIDPAHAVAREQLQLLHAPLTSQPVDPGSADGDRATPPGG